MSQLDLIRPLSAVIPGKNVWVDSGAKVVSVKINLLSFIITSRRSKRDFSSGRL
ncbi:MAG: hypothetical protein IPN86_20550 [Saprospiraceae bacterium]|nr:hypothetical protein [Saprospiraceae bacterium]